MRGYPLRRRMMMFEIAEETGDTNILGIPDIVENQQAKQDAGKLKLSLVPMQIVRDIAEVRMYGIQKYTDPDNWKRVEKQRYIDALLRHTLLYLEDPDGVDEESGIPHYKHMACNMAFICALENNEK